MVHAKKYKTTSAFIEVMQKKLWPLFSRHGVYTQPLRSSQPSITLGWVNRVPACVAGVVPGTFTCVRWLVTVPYYPAGLGCVLTCLQVLFIDYIYFVTKQYLQTFLITSLALLVSIKNRQCIGRFHSTITIFFNVSRFYVFKF